MQGLALVSFAVGLSAGCIWSDSVKKCIPDENATHQGCIMVVNTSLDGKVVADCYSCDLDVNKCTFPDPPKKTIQTNGLLLAASPMEQAEHVHLAYAGDDGMRVTWKVSSGVPTAGHVVFDTVSRNEISEYQFKAEQVKSVEYLSGYGQHRMAKLSGLVPGQKYYYRVVDADGPTEEFSFKAKPGHDSPTKIAVYGDLGYGVGADYGFANSTIYRVTERKDEVDFFIHIGDVGYADNSFISPMSTSGLIFTYESYFDTFMQAMENVFSSHPYMVLPGNHESECHSPACNSRDDLKMALSNFTAYNARFNMPAAESGGVESMWYSFDYGRAHIVMANTETDFKNAPEEGYGSCGELCRIPAGGFGAQPNDYMDWLEKELIEANKPENRKLRPFLIVSGHRVWYTADGSKIHDEVVQAHLEPLLKKYNVDLYLGGHMHTYHRHLPTASYREKGFNTAYVLPGAPGNSEYSKRGWQTDALFSEKNENFHWAVDGVHTSYGILEINAEGTELTWTLYDSQTEKDVLDTFTIKKSSPLTSENVFHVNGLDMSVPRTTTSFSYAPSLALVFMTIAFMM